MSALSQAVCALLIVASFLAGCAERPSQDAAQAPSDVRASDARGTAPTGASGLAATTAASWQMTASQYADSLGMRYTYDCPPGGEPRSVWGSGPYTTDSGVCTAGVHAGVVSLEDGGRMTIEIAQGQERYAGSTRNEVLASDWGSYGSSFVVVAD